MNRKVCERKRSSPTVKYHPTAEATVGLTGLRAEIVTQELPLKSEVPCSVTTALLNIGTVCHMGTGNVGRERPFGKFRC